jgi:hypothetical protein
MTKQTKAKGRGVSADRDTTPDAKTRPAKAPRVKTPTAVSDSGDTPLVSTNGDIPLDARRDRESFREYVLAKAAPWYREHLGHLYLRHDDWNAAYFENKLAPPYLLFTPPKTPRALGDYASISAWGGVGQIRVRPTLVTGEHPLLRPGPEYAEGHRRFVEDVALHESVHAYCDEVLHEPEDSYKGHGPVFARECNRIGEKLGLPPVRPAKCRGPLRDLPSCAQWPHCVRPREYYLGALAEEKQPPPPPDAAALLSKVLVAAGKFAEKLAAGSLEGEAALLALAEAAPWLPAGVIGGDHAPVATGGGLAVYLRLGLLVPVSGNGDTPVSTNGDTAKRRRRPKRERAS